MHIHMAFLSAIYVQGVMSTNMFVCSYRLVAIHAHIYYHDTHSRYVFLEAKVVHKHELKLYACHSKKWADVIMRKLGPDLFVKWVTIFNEDRSKCGVRVFNPFTGQWLELDVFIILRDPIIRCRDLELKIRDRMAAQKVISKRRVVKNAFGYHPNQMLDLALNQELQQHPVIHEEAGKPA